MSSYLGLNSNNRESLIEQGHDHEDLNLKEELLRKQLVVPESQKIFKVNSKDLE